MLSLSVWKILAIYIVTLAMKLFGYIISGYFVLLADALHGISDIAGILLLISSGIISRKPSDESHPLGHEMARNVASLVVAVVFITIIAFELFKEGIIKIISPAPYYSNTLIVIGVELAVLLLLLLSAYILHKEKGILSRTLFLESINDALSTFAAIAGIVVVSIGYKIFDGVASIFIAILISYNAFKLIKYNTRFLLGMSPSDKFYRDVEKICKSFKEVKGVHDMIATYIGENKIHLDMHITVDGKMSVDEADKLSEKIAEKLQKEMPEIEHLTIHFCPHYGEKRKML